MVALADKVSTLTSLFAAGEIPTSSKDPFALRRQAVGIVKLICHFRLSLNISELFDNALEASKAILDFLFNRFKFFLKDHFKSTLIEAVLATSSGNFYSDFDKLACLTKFIASQEGHNTLLSIKRITNILQPTTEAASSLNEKLFNEQEVNLHEAIATAQTEIQSLDKNNHLARLTTFSKLAKAIDLFFDKVLVMDDNQELRTNRLALLQKANTLFSSFASFSLIETT
jgi:glycyl-tRNA synthetase beta chain